MPKVTSADQLLPKWSEYKELMFRHLHEEEMVGRGLHSSTSQLNLSRF